MAKINKPTFLVSRTFIFDSAHHLVDYKGKCAFVHGHRYELTVTYKCQQNDSGITIDFTQIKDVIEDHILDYLDHHDLNEIPDMGNPTAENILLWCYKRIANLAFGLLLYSLRLKEGRDTEVELRRGGMAYD